MNLPIIQQQITFDTEELLRNHPPVWRHPHKKAVYDYICREGFPESGKLSYTRWTMSPLSERIELHFCEVQCKQGFYDYSCSTPNCWHVNFADPRLFAAYGSALMAQDEWQVLEHPVLGSVREALLHTGYPALTRENGRSTPILITNVPRLCSLDLTSTTAAIPWWGRLFPNHHPTCAHSGTLYGNAFSAASKERILQATTLLKPPVFSNIIAIAAPTGTGRYSYRQILDILQTAFSAFAASAMESERSGVNVKEIEIHTGWWGCGAFGGNRVLMALLQMLAARMAGVGKLHFYIGESSNRFDFDEGLSYLKVIEAEDCREVSAIVQMIEDLGFAWGKGDGN